MDGADRVEAVIILASACGLLHRHDRRNEALFPIMD